MLEMLQISGSAESSGRNPPLPLFRKHSLVFVNKELLSRERLRNPCLHVAPTSLAKWYTSTGCITLTARRRTGRLIILGEQANDFSK